MLIKTFNFNFDRDLNLFVYVELNPVKVTCWVELKQVNRLVSCKCRQGNKMKKKQNKC